MPDSDPEIQQGLRQARDAIRLKIENYARQLAQIEELLSEVSVEPEDARPLNPIVSKLPPLDAAKSFFAENPSQEFRAADLCDRFELMRRQGRLRSTAKNLQIAANDALRKLTEQGEIVRIEDGRRVRFKKKEPAES